MRRPVEPISESESLTFLTDFRGSKGIIFVVDSNDTDVERIKEARNELHKMLLEDELCDAVLLVVANKQDLPNAMSAAEVTDKLELHSLESRKWSIHVGFRLTCYPLTIADRLCLHSAGHLRPVWRRTL